MTQISDTIFAFKGLKSVRRTFIVDEKSRESRLDPVHGRIARRIYLRAAGQDREAGDCGE